MRSLEWTLIPHGKCPSEKTLGHRHTQTAPRRDGVYTPRSEASGGGWRWGVQSLGPGDRASVAEARVSPIFLFRCHTFTECSEFTNGPSGTLYRRPLWSQCPAQTYLVVTPSSAKPPNLVFVPAVPVSWVSQHAAADALCRRQRTLERTRVPSVSPTPSRVTGSLRQHGPCREWTVQPRPQMLCTPRAYTGLVPSRGPQAVQDADSAPAGRRYLWERGEGGLSL